MKKITGIILTCGMGGLTLSLLCIPLTSSPYPMQFKTVDIIPFQSTFFQSSEILTVSSWMALQNKQYDRVLKNTEECIRSFGKIALEQQAALNRPVDPGKYLEHKASVFANWALNDVATSYFIRALAYKEMGSTDKAIQTFEVIIQNFPYAQCWDLRGWFWSPADGARDQILMMEKGVDFEDYRSETLTTKAWNQLEAKDYARMTLYADKVISLFQKTALEMQADLKSPIDLEDKDKTFANWALNDVATSYFIKGLALKEQGLYEEAKSIFNYVSGTFTHARCWDLRGWFWSPADGARDQILAMEMGLDFGNYTSETLTTRAWECLQEGDHEKARLYADKCITLYEEKAHAMQAALAVGPEQAMDDRETIFANWALNDVATSWFIKGLALKEQGLVEEAKGIFQYVGDTFSFARCWDTRGWFWSPAEGAKDQILMMEKGVDFGDFRSETLMVGAWKAWEARDYEKMQIYAEKCIDLYEEKAHAMQAALKNPVNPGSNLENSGEVFSWWALNDIATSYFIKGLALRGQGLQEEAKKYFRYTAQNFPFGQCWDPKGWFWKPAEGALDQITEMEKGVDFGDYQSVTLTVKAWEALASGEFEKLNLYADKCIRLFEETAFEMQASLKEPVDPGEDLENMEEVFSHWALNDVATIWFIKGLALKEQGLFEEAKGIFQYVGNTFPSARCWDTRGWFWSPAEGAHDQIICMENGVDFDRYTSQVLTVKSWEMLSLRDYRKLWIYTGKCIALFEKQALQMQAALGGPVDPGKKLENKAEVFAWWALNDVATCHFIRAVALKQQGNVEAAAHEFHTVLDNYAYAQCWDERGWFWKVATGAQNELDAIRHGIDFGEYSSAVLTSKAWDALKLEKWNEVHLLADKCLELYEKTAREMQDGLGDTETQSQLMERESIFSRWALNDTGTILFIKAKALQLDNRSEEAKAVFRYVIDHFPDAMCWDPNGYFWNVAEGAQDQILMMETGVDFGDYTSETLTTQAWLSLIEGDFTRTALYANKCIKLYANTARDFQASLTTYAGEGDEFNYWALNDVGTSLFILGEAALKQEKYHEAIQFYRMLIEHYAYAQCWDPKGYFWKPAEAARDRLKNIRNKLRTTNVMLTFSEPTQVYLSTLE